MRLLIYWGLLAALLKPGWQGIDLGKMFMDR